MQSSTETPVTESRAEDEAPPSPSVPQDLIAGIVLGAVVGLFWLRAGPLDRDWVFPLVLSWAGAVIAAYLVVRGLLGYGDRINARPRILTGGGLDISVFIALTIAYVALLKPVGYWIMTSGMIFATALYLDTNRSKKNMLLAAVVAIVVSVVAFLLLTKVFYVPVPKARWLPI